MSQFLAGSTSHIPVKQDVLTSLSELYEDKPKTKLTDLEKSDCCIGGSHERYIMELEGDVIACPCRNCRHIMIVNHEKFEDWKKSQSEVITQ